MINFIEITDCEDAKILINKSHIISIAPSPNKKFTNITLTLRNDYGNVTISTYEHYEEIIKRI